MDNVEKPEPEGGFEPVCAREGSGSRRLALLTAAALCALAGVLRFALRGYDVFAYILVLAAVLVMLRYYGPPILFKAAVGLTAALAVAVCITEVPIVSNARTDAGDDTRFVVVLGARVDKGGTPSFSLLLRLRSTLAFLEEHPQATARTDAGDDTRFVVVLGARVDKGGTPSFSLLLRLRSTLAFLEEHPQATAILSGGQGRDEDMPEGQAMYNWLVDHGVSPDRLIVESKATNTRQNLELSFDLIRERGYDPNGCTAVVSSSYHLYRAKLLAQQLGVEVSGVAANPGNPFVALNYFIREAPAVWKELLLRG